MVPKESEITIEKVQIKDDDHEKVMHLDHLHFSTTFINPGGDTGGDTGWVGVPISKLVYSIT